MGEAEAEEAPGIVMAAVRLVAGGVRSWAVRQAALEKTSIIRVSTPSVYHIAVYQCRYQVNHRYSTRSFQNFRRSPICYP